MPSMEYVCRLSDQTLLIPSQSYCTYTAYGETGDDPDIDPIYPDPQPGGYKGKFYCSNKVGQPMLTSIQDNCNAVYTSRPM